MAPRFVAPYRKSGKNDGNDAEAICEAVQRPNMRFVPVKSVDQQAVLALHRVRHGFVEERTATINRIRAILVEFGVVLAHDARHVRHAATAAAEALPTPARRCVEDLRDHLRVLDERIAAYDRELEQQAKANDASATSPSAETRWRSRRRTPASCGRCWLGAAASRPPESRSNDDKFHWRLRIAR